MIMADSASWGGIGKGNKNVIGERVRMGGTELSHVIGRETKVEARSEEVGIASGT